MYNIMVLTKKIKGNLIINLIVRERHIVVIGSRINAIFSTMAVFPVSLVIFPFNLTGAIHSYLEEIDINKSVILPEAVMRRRGGSPFFSNFSFSPMYDLAQKSSFKDSKRFPIYILLPLPYWVTDMCVDVTPMVWHGQALWWLNSDSYEPKIKST